MKVEQRIGRIDRLGQQFETIRIINLMYADTVEADIYQTLRNRIVNWRSFRGSGRRRHGHRPSLISSAISRPRRTTASIWTS